MSEPTTTIAEYSPTVHALAEFRSKYQGLVFDVSKPKGLAEAKDARADLRKTRIALETMRKQIKQPALDRCRDIDTEAKRITAELEALEDPIDAQIKAEEQRKEREKAEAEAAARAEREAVTARMDAIKALPVRALGATVADIDALIAECLAIDPLLFPKGEQGVIQAAAVYERSMALSALKAAKAARVEQDAKDAQAEIEREELHRLRAQAAAVEADRLRREQEEAARQEAERQRIADEAEAHARQEREEQARREGEERARREAAEAVERAQRETEAANERARIAAEQAERDRIEAERRAEADKAEAVRRAQEDARREADHIERLRLAEDKRLADEETKRAANKRHRAAINNAAVAALVGNGIAEDVAKQVVTLIAQGSIPSTTINY